MPSPQTAVDEGLVLFDPEVDLRFQVREITPDNAGPELERIAFDASYRAVAEKKFQHHIIKAHALSAPGANVLKQTCLSLGTDAGVHHGAINCTIDREAVLISATTSQLEKLTQKLRPQPFGLKPLSESMMRMRLRQKRLQNQPAQLMAILNITPDSFSDGGQLNTIDAALHAAEQALAHGATCLDIGGESTRPGSTPVDVETELSRVIPVIEAIAKRFPEAMLSIDTRKALVAQAALEAGAHMVNDVSGLTYDPQMMAVVAQAQCSVVIMHSQGTPDTMQENPTYDDVVEEVAGFFYAQIAQAIEAGIHPEKIILDPGFGFGKTVAHNLALLKGLPELVSIGFPMLVGLSRKSFLTLGDASIETNHREALTAAAIALAHQAGARWFRVHDTASMAGVLRLLNA